jgi:hypothetical protein
LVESAQVHRPAQHPHILLRVRGIERSHRFVPEQSFVTTTFALSQVIDSHAQVNGFIDQNEVATRQLVHHTGAVSRRILSPKLDGRQEGWYGFRRVFGSKLFRLGVPAKIIYDDPSAYRCVHNRGVLHHRRSHRNLVAMEKLETASGKKWAKRKSPYSSKLQK